MKEKIAPLGFMLLVERDAPETMFGGLELPSVYMKAQRKGKIISLPLRDDSNMKMFTGDNEFANVKEGDYVYFTERAGLQVDDNLFFVRITDLIAKVL